MRKFSAAAVAAFALAGTAVAVSASPAFASTVVVTGGGAVAGTASGAGLPVLTDTKTGTTLKCTSASIHGTIPNGTFSSLLDIGQITSVTFGGCTVGGVFSFGVTAEFPSNTPPPVTNDGNWDFNATGLTSGGVTPGNLTQISADISGTGCTADVDGTSADSNTGSLTGTYNNTSGALKANASAGLTIYAVSGCGGLIGSGDPATFSATYIVTNSGGTHPQITVS